MLSNEQPILKETMHNCVIGLIHDYELSCLVSIDDLKEHIRESIQYNECLDKDPVFRNNKDLKTKVYSLKDYADKRKSTDLTRFDYCPICGKKIDWKAIKCEGK